MIKNIRKHWILWLFAVVLISLSIKFPDVEIILGGGFAWFLTVGICFIALIVIITEIKGGEVTYSSKGLITIIQERRQRKNEQQSISIGIILPEEEIWSIDEMKEKIRQYDEQTANKNP